MSAPLDEALLLALLREQIGASESESKAPAHPAYTERRRDASGGSGGGGASGGGGSSSSRAAAANTSSQAAVRNSTTHSVSSASGAAASQAQPAQLLPACGTTSHAAVAAAAAASPLETLHALLQEVESSRPVSSADGSASRSSTADCSPAADDPTAGDAPNEWHRRHLSLNASWATQRPHLHNAAVAEQAVPQTGACCDQCDASAVLECIDCTAGIRLRLCGACDEQRHPTLHFHRRYTFSSGFRQPIPMTAVFSEHGQQSTGVGCHACQVQAGIRCALWQEC